jgi:hypothetical protein
VEVPAGRSAGVAGARVPETDPGGDDGDGGAVAPCVGDGGRGVPLGNRACGGVGASRAKSSGSAVGTGTGRLGGDDGEGGEEQPSICGICLFLASTAARLLARVASLKVFARFLGGGAGCGDRAGGGGPGDGVASDGAAGGGDAGGGDTANVG